MAKYLVPQECGNKTGVRWAKVTDRKGRGMLFKSDKMEFSALPYTPHEIQNAAHPFELPKVHYTVVRASMQQMGVGGDDSWGAKTHPEYLLEHPAEFARELLMAYVSQNSLTAILFSGSQANHFADSIERSIKQMIFEKYPELKEDTAMNVMLSYCIQGSYHAYQKNRSGDIMTVIDVIAGMTGAIRPMYEERLGENRS